MKIVNETVIRKKSLRISILIGLFLPPFSMLDVPLYASRTEKRRFLLKSAYPLLWHPQGEGIFATGGIPVFYALILKQKAFSSTA